VSWLSLALGAVAGIVLTVAGLLLALDWPGLWGVLGWSLL
jgi:hypothetical protein